MVKQCNLELSALITEKIGDNWITDLDQLKKLEPFAEDTKFHKRFNQIKLNNKKVLARIIQENQGLPLILAVCLIFKLNAFTNINVN